MKNLLAFMLFVFTLVPDSHSATSYVQSASGKGGSSASSISVSLTGVGAGNLIVVYASWYNATYPTATCSDGTSTLEALTAVSAWNNKSQIFYLLSANGGDKTYTVTFANSSGPRTVFVWEFASTGDTWYYDTSNQGSAQGSTTASSGVITTQSTYPQVIVSNGVLGNYAASTSSPLIGSYTPTEPATSPIDTYDHQYYLLNQTVTSGAATVSYSTNTDWVRNVAALYA